MRRTNIIKIDMNIGKYNHAHFIMKVVVVFQNQCLNWKKKNCHSVSHTGLRTKFALYEYDLNRPFRQKMRFPQNIFTTTLCRYESKLLGLPINHKRRLGFSSMKRLGFSLP